MNQYKITMNNGQCFFAETEFTLDEILQDMYEYEAYKLTEKVLVVVAFVSSVELVEEG